jgi:integrase
MPPDLVDAFLAMARQAALADDSARVDFAVGEYRFLFAAGPAAVPLPGKVRSPRGPFVGKGSVERLPGSAEADPCPVPPIVDGSAPPETVGQVIAMYLRHAEAGAHPPTFVNARFILDMFVAKHGSMLWADAKPYHLKLFVDGNPLWRSAWTKKRAISTVRSAFGWAAKLGIIDRNVFTGTPVPKGERGNAMEPKEFQAMLRNSTAVFRRVLIFLKFTGCRPGEMERTEWPNYDAANARIVLAKHKTSKRTGRPRIIMLNHVAVKLIEWIKRHRPHYQFVFVNSKGWKWGKCAICWRIKQARASTGVRPDTTLYACRHSFVNEAIKSGIDLPTVAALAGHSNIASTMHYSHVGDSPEHLTNAVNTVFKHKNGRPKERPQP